MILKKVGSLFHAFIILFSYQSHAPIKETRNNFAPDTFY
jgi:hypothetical protein